MDRGRDGWCFELNGAFSSLLRDLGFQVRWLPATVLLSPASTDPSHLILEVKLDHRYLVDVGFGDSFIKPLRLDLDQPQDGGSGQFVITTDGNHQTLFQVGDEGVLDPQYRFDGDEWDLADFDGASARLQTAPGLHWTESRFATRLLEGGPDRVTLLKDRIKFRRGGEWHQEPVAAEDWGLALNSWFGMKP